MAESERHILIIETATRIGSAAVATGGGLMAEARLPGQMRHAGELLPTIDRLLADVGWQPRDLTDVFVSVGPGSFTGLRVGVTIARTLAWSTGVRIVAVSTLDGLARNALALKPAPEHLAVLLDAKRGQAYAAAFERTETGYRKTIDDALVAPEAFLTRCPQPVAVLGEGVPAHREAIERSGARVLAEECWIAQAESVYAVGLEMARAGRYTPGPDLEPHYIRRPEAEEKWEQLHGPQGRQIT